MQNNQKFILKIWRKLSTHKKSDGSEPVHDDEIIGITTIDLGTFSPESNISGHYNIVDAAGHTNGQLKVIN